MQSGSQVRDSGGSSAQKGHTASPFGFLLQPKNLPQYGMQMQTEVLNRQHFRLLGIAFLKQQSFH